MFTILDYESEKGIMKKRKQVEIEQVKRPVDNHFRMTFKEYEYAKRLAYENGVAVSEVIRQHLYSFNWLNSLKVLIKKHHQMGFEDAPFYHSKDPRKKKNG